MAERLIGETDILYFPFNAEEDDGGEPDRLYDATDWADYFRQFISNGVYPNPSTGLQLQSRYGTKVLTVMRGSAFCDGHFYLQKVELDFPIDEPHMTLPRRDIVIVRLNRLTRTMSILYRPGTPATSPQVLPLERTADIWDLKLADIQVNANAAQITNANITDTRLNTTFCGIVHGLVQQVDTTTIFNQYLQWFTELKNAAELDVAKQSTDLETWITRFMADTEQDKATIFAALAAWDTAFRDTRETQFSTWYNLFTGTSEADFAQWFDSIRSLIDENVAATLTTKLMTLEGDLGTWAQRTGQTIETFFNDDGTATQIVTITATGVQIARNDVTFNDDGTITEVLVNNLTATTTTKTTSFSEDGKSIKEVIV